MHKCVGLSAGRDTGTARSDDAASQIALESVTCLRDVHSYNLQDVMVQRYAQQLRAGNAAAVRAALSQGAARAVTGSTHMLLLALAFWYGGREVELGRMSAEDVLRVLFAMLFAVLSMDQARTTFPDLKHGKAAVARLFQGALATSLALGTAPAWRAQHFPPQAERCCSRPATPCVATESVIFQHCHTTFTKPTM